MLLVILSPIRMISTITFVQSPTHEVVSPPAPMTHVALTYPQLLTRMAGRRDSAMTAAATCFPWLIQALMHTIDRTQPDFRIIMRTTAMDISATHMTHLETTGPIPGIT